MHACGGQRVTCRSQLYSATLRPGTKLIVRLDGKCLNLLRHSAGLSPPPVSINAQDVNTIIKKKKTKPIKSYALTK